jgi:hypothetical protein
MLGDPALLFLIKLVCKGTAQGMLSQERPCALVPEHTVVTAGVAKKIGAELGLGFA